MVAVDWGSQRFYMRRGGRNDYIDIRFVVIFVVIICLVVWPHLICFEKGAPGKHLGLLQQHSFLVSFIYLLILQGELHCGVSVGPGMNFNSTEVKSKVLAYSCWSCRHYPFALIRIPFFFFFLIYWRYILLFSHLNTLGGQWPCRYQQEVGGFYRCILNSSVDQLF